MGKGGVWGGFLHGKDTISRSYLHLARGNLGQDETRHGFTRQGQKVGKARCAESAGNRYKNIWKLYLKNGFYIWTCVRAHTDTHTIRNMQIQMRPHTHTHTHACILTCAWNIVTNKCQSIELYKYNYLFRLNAVVIVVQKSIITGFFFLKFKIAASPVVGQHPMIRPKSKRLFSISGLSI